MVQCQVLVARGEVYSSNEELEDFSTERLRFVLLPFYLAELYQMISDDKRGSHLASAKNNLRQFLDEMMRLRLMVEADARVWKRECKPVADGNQRREEKMERGRREMQNKKKLREIRQRMQEAEKRGVEVDTVIDDDLMREAVMTEIQLAVRTALDSWELILQEEPLLERQRLMQAQTDKWKQHEKKDEPIVSKPVTVDLPPGYEKQLGKHGEITIKRATLQDQVFRPGYNMATVSIEEAGERDYQEAMERQARQKLSEQQREADAEDDDDNTIKYDSVTVYKDRDWDAFKDDNPTGSGNTTGNLG